MPRRFRTTPTAAALVAALAIAAPAAGQTVDVDEATVTVGEVGSKSISGASQTVTGITLVQQSARDTTAKVTTVPDVAAPSIVGGNPCVISASLGGSMMGFGIAGGVGLEDDDCETRQVTALVHNMGQRGVAYLHLCTWNDEFRATVEMTGHTCLSFADQVGAQSGETDEIAMLAPAPIIPNAAASMTVAALGACSDREYWASMPMAWPEWSAACQARHEAR